MSAPLTLYSFSVSHFSEKIRWTLDRLRLNYTEVRWVPFFHAPLVLMKGLRATSVPIIEGEGECIQDSTRILHWLEAKGWLAPLLPAALREEIYAVEDRFDRVGFHVIRHAYQRAFDSPQDVIEMWTLDANAIQRRAVKLGYPLMQRGFKRLLRMSPQSVARSRAVIDEALSWIESRLAEGKRFLAGDQFTVADITAAALLAPLACPPEHPAYGRPEYQAALAEYLGDWNARPAIVWVRDIYRQYRLFN